MHRRVTAVPTFDDLLSTLTNQPASLYDEFSYGFEHARLRTRNSRYSLSGGQSRPDRTARITCDKLPELSWTPKLRQVAKVEPCP